jgi:hypothetical protein
MPEVHAWCAALRTSLKGPNGKKKAPPSHGLVSSTSSATSSSAPSSPVSASRRKKVLNEIGATEATSSHTAPDAHAVTQREAVQQKEVEETGKEPDVTNLAHESETGFKPRVMFRLDIGSAVAAPAKVVVRAESPEAAQMLPPLDERSEESGKSGEPAAEDGREAVIPAMPASDSEPSLDQIQPLLASTCTATAADKAEFEVDRAGWSADPANENVAAIRSEVASGAVQLPNVKFVDDPCSNVQIEDRVSEPDLFEQASPRETPETAVMPSIAPSTGPTVHPSPQAKGRKSRWDVGAGDALPASPAHEVPGGAAEPSAVDRDGARAVAGAEDADRRDSGAAGKDEGEGDSGRADSRVREDQHRHSRLGGMA